MRWRVAPLAGRNGVPPLCLTPLALNLAKSTDNRGDLHNQPLFKTTGNTLLHTTDHTWPETTPAKTEGLASDEDT